MRRTPTIEFVSLFVKCDFHRARAIHGLTGVNGGQVMARRNLDKMFPGLKDISNERPAKISRFPGHREIP